MISITVRQMVEVLQKLEPDMYTDVYEISVYRNSSGQALVRFYSEREANIAQAEREECARLCDDIGGDDVVYACADAIRKRGS